jgi:glycerophosphoryl diester phosphodiesterase
VRRIQLASGEGGPADARGAVTYRAMMGEGLADVAAYAHGIGVEKAMIVPRDGEGRAAPPTDLIARAHAAGLKVHAWTFRAENYFLPVELRSGADPRAHGDLAAEIRQHLALGLDGFFCDFPGLGVAARTRA